MEKFRIKKIQLCIVQSEAVQYSILSDILGLVKYKQIIAPLLFISPWIRHLFFFLLWWNNRISIYKPFIIVICWLTSLFCILFITEDHIYWNIVITLWHVTNLNPDRTDYHVSTSIATSFLLFQKFCLNNCSFFLNNMITKLSLLVKTFLPTYIW